MNNWIKKASIILMVLIFFISTTGFTLYIHVCSCFNVTKHAVFNEIVKSKPICCCEKENQFKENNYSNTSFDYSECCKNKHLLIKSATYMLPVISKLSEDKTFKLVSYFIPTKTLFSKENNKDYEKLASHYFPPPLLYGRSLIISFSQFKIPLSA
jgi:hypothetical protein